MGIPIVCSNRGFRPKPVPDRWKDDNPNYRIIRRLNMLMVPYKVKGQELRDMIQRKWNRPCDVRLVIKYNEFHVKLSHNTSNTYEILGENLEDVTKFLNELDSIGILREQINGIAWENAENDLYIPLGVFIDRCAYEYDSVPITYQVLNEEDVKST